MFYFFRLLNNNCVSCKVNIKRLVIPWNSKQRQTASLTSAPGQNIQASQAVHGIDEILTGNFWSLEDVMIQYIPKILTYFANVDMFAKPCTTNFDKLCLLSTSWGERIIFTLFYKCKMKLLDLQDNFSLLPSQLVVSHLGTMGSKSFRTLIFYNCSICLVTDKQHRHRRIWTLSLPIVTYGPTDRKQVIVLEILRDKWQRDLLIFISE